MLVKIRGIECFTVALTMYSRLLQNKNKKQLWWALKSKKKYMYVVDVQ